MRWTQEQYAEYQRKRLARSASRAMPIAKNLRETSYSPKSKPMPTRGWQGEQTKTEQKYNREVLRGAGRFEPVTFVLAGGGRYTPDFMTVDEGTVTFHEVKGSYRLQSYNRAQIAFKEAACAFPTFRFVWAEWTGKEWMMKTYEPMEGES